MKILMKPKTIDCNYMKYLHMDADSWNRLIRNPIVKKDKHEAPLIIWGTTKKGFLDRDPQTGLMRCTADNIGWVYALPVDVDNGCTIDEFVKDFHRYSFQLYTTHSWHNGKEGDRFRVFFPLQEPIYTEWLVKPVKDKLVELFSMSDSSCFDRGHWQVVPTICDESADYMYVQHDGERLSFERDNFAEIAREYKEDSHWRREIAEADRDPRSNHDGALKWVQRIFDETQEGSRNRTVYAKLMWLRDTVGATYNEVISLHAPAGFDEEMNKMIERIYGR